MIVMPERPRRVTGLEGLRLPGGVRLDVAVAEGGSGVVFRGRHEGLGRDVAVKVSHAADEQAAARALREARIVAALDAPGIVRVYQCGRLDDGRAWVAMEWIDGVTLEDAADRRWPAAQVADAGARIAAALARAHAAGVVHRDLKPANVMIRRGGEIVVVDFGIARASGEAATSQSRLAGTPHYMAPEQALGDAVDARTDLYALGCVLYRLASGHVPFEGAAIEVMLAHLGQVPPPIPGCEPRLAALIFRLLAKRPGDRLGDAAACAGELARLARSLGGPERPDPAAISGRAATAPAPVRVAPVDPFLTTMQAGLTLPRRRRRAAPVRGLPLVIAVLAAVGAVAASGFQIVRGLREVPLAAVISPAPPSEPSAPPPLDPDAPVVLVVDNGFAMRATLPRAPVAGAEMVVELAIWDDEGRPISAREVAITVRDPAGVTVALGVRGTAGVFRVRQRAALAGTYVITTFAPSGETTFAVRVEVSPTPAA